MVLTRNVFVSLCLLICSLEANGWYLKKNRWVTWGILFIIHFLEYFIICTSLISLEEVFRLIVIARSCWVWSSRNLTEKQEGAATYFQRDQDGEQLGREDTSCCIHLPAALFRPHHAHWGGAGRAGKVSNCRAVQCQWRCAAVTMEEGT